VNTLFCTGCGHQNPVGSRFCASCGHQLVVETDDRTLGMAPLDEHGLPASDATTPAPAGATTAQMVVTSGHRSGSRFAISGEVVNAGRHPESEIFLDDITVSRRHVEIRRVEGGHVVADAGSLNGTYLNGQRIDTAPLSNGDEVQIGKFKLLYLVEKA